jgi:hypothetical protein
MDLGIEELRNSLISNCYPVLSYFISPGPVFWLVLLREV